jgi:hypothetical protein
VGDCLMTDSSVARQARIHLSMQPRDACSSPLHSSNAGGGRKAPLLRRIVPTDDVFKGPFQLSSTFVQGHEERVDFIFQ